MYKRTFIILGFIFPFVLTAHAQEALDQHISLQVENMTLIEILEEITTRTNMRFSYNPELFSEEPMDLKINDSTLREVLDLLVGEGFQYIVRGSYIIIQQRNGSPFSASTVTIKGEITDASTGKKLKNTSVYQVNTLTPTLTDSEGTYELSSATRSDDITVIAISKFNYQDTVIRVSGSHLEPIKLSLRPLAKPQAPLLGAADSSEIVALFSGKKSREHLLNVTIEEERWAQLSFLPGLGTNGRLGAKVTNNLSLNLISGYANGTNGFEIGGVLNINRRKVNGLQIAGFGNLTGSTANGIQVAGFLNHSQDTIRGMQIAGFGNFGGMAAHGMQISGFINMAMNVKGFQIAGVMNHVKSEMKGVQIAGLINRAGTLNGLQIGVINKADTVNKGIMFGLININQNSMFDYELGYNDVTPANFTFRSGANWFYTILTTGVNIWDNHLFGFGAGFGSHWESWKLYGEMEVTTNQIQPFDRFFRDFSMDNRFHLNLGLRITPQLSVNAGGILHYFITDSDPSDSFSNLLGQESLYRHSFDRTYMKLWAGKRFGLRWKI